jgi:hypothetical protein
MNLQRLLVNIEDVGNFDADNYGNNISLTSDNGVQVICSVNGVSTDHTDGLLIQSNAEWNRLAGIDTVLSDYGTGNQHLNVRYTMAKARPDGVVLKGDEGDRFIVRLKGNFTGLVSHYFMVQGFYHRKEY